MNATRNGSIPGGSRVRRIGKYQVLGRLGRGGMGVVYKAKLPVVERLVALKLLEPSEHMVALLGMDEVRRRFELEAKVMAAIRHPHVAQVTDYDTHGEGQEARPFLVMDYYCDNLGALMGEGHRLEEPSRRLEPGEALRYGHELLQALARLHDIGLVHRDVKPFNCMLDDSGALKLIDFGLSKLRGEAEGERPMQMKVGSPWYAAPEQEADPEAAGEASDLYGVGVTLYRMLTGRLPFDDEHDYTPPSRMVDGLDQAFDAFFAQALDQEPARRHASAEAMLKDVADLARHWEAGLAAACALPPEFEAAPGAGEPVAGPPRARAIKVRPSRAQERFPVDGLMRPLAPRGGALEEQGPGELFDPATGLVWRQHASPFPMAWDAAGAYLARLGPEGLWRLPTAEELLSLVRVPERLGDFCLDPVFEPEKPRLWSADRRAFNAAWFLNAAHGFLCWQDFSCRLWVRGVREARRTDHA